MKTSPRWTASGKVTAVGVGQARIRAVSEVFEETPAAECVVTVNKNDVQIEGVALNETAVEVKPGDKLQLSASVLPEGSPQGVTWSSSNAEVASVDEAGLVTAIAEGTAVVTRDFFRRFLEVRVMHRYGHCLRSSARSRDGRMRAAGRRFA